MGDIDRRRPEAVRKLRDLGLAWRAGARRNANDADLLSEADGLSALPVRRGDELDGCKGSLEEAEPTPIIDALVACQEKCRPRGELPWRKG